MIPVFQHSPFGPLSHAEKGSIMKRSLVSAFQRIQPSLCIEACPSFLSTRTTRSSLILILILVHYFSLPIHHPCPLLLETHRDPVRVISAMVSLVLTAPAILNSPTEPFRQPQDYHHQSSRPPNTNNPLLQIHLLSP